MAPKISVVMSYFNRKPQLLLTLDGMKRSKQAAVTEVIIVDDASDQPLHHLDDMKQGYYPFTIKVIRVPVAAKRWANACIPFNIGFAHATGDIIVIQNPEVCHVGDVLDHVSRTVVDASAYYTYSCYASPGFGQNALLHMLYKQLWEKEEKEQESKEASINWGHEVYSQFICRVRSIWYNHPHHNPRALHFLAATMRSNITRIGGFDETYFEHPFYDDDEFLARMRLIVPVKIISTEQVYGIHQFHVGGSTSNVHLMHYNKARFELLQNKIKEAKTDEERAKLIAWPKTEAEKEDLSQCAVRDSTITIIHPADTEKQDLNKP